MTTKTIGQQFANAVADHISRHMFPPHRGVIEVRNPFGPEPLVVAFGNDCYSQDDRTRTYVDALLAEIGRHDPVLGIDSDNGYTWAIVVPIDDEALVPFFSSAVEHELYVRYREARGLADDDGMVMLRKRVCDREILDHTNGEPLRIDGWESIN
jgi:hypothetical protein